MLSISIQPVHSGHEFIFQRNSNMLLFDRNNETRISFLGWNFIFEIYRQFRFWGQNLFFQFVMRNIEEWGFKNIAESFV